MATTARYDRIGLGYTSYRQPDPRIEAQIWAAVGEAGRIVNVGAGTGSYERPGRPMIAVEPSPVMLEQRSASAAPAVRGAAEQLPFGAGTFDVALALLTIHHWSDLEVGLAELQRVARRQIVMTIDPPVHDAMWMVSEYVPAIRGMSDHIPLDLVTSLLQARRVEVVPIPADCIDGFCMAYWARPESYLDPVVRSNTSAFARLEPSDYEPGLERLARDLGDGTWDRHHGDLLGRDQFDVGLRLVIAG
jgi:SAM-dependent methyltransferase